jgi:hypothetical protein
MKFSSSQQYSSSKRLTSSKGFSSTNKFSGSKEFSSTNQFTGSTEGLDDSLNLVKSEYLAQTSVVSGSDVPDFSSRFTDSKTFNSNDFWSENTATDHAALPVYTDTVAFSVAYKFRSSSRISAGGVYSTLTSRTSSRSTTSAYGRSSSTRLSFAEGIGYSGYSGYSPFANDDTVNGNSILGSGENDDEYVNESEGSFHSSVIEKDAKIVIEEANLLWVIITVSCLAVCLGLYGYMLYVELQKVGNEEKAKPTPQQNQKTGSKDKPKRKSSK